jgi:hypothetical protein
MVNTINGQSSDTAFIATIRYDTANKKARLMLSGGVYGVVSQIIMGMADSLDIVYGLDTFDGKEVNWPFCVEFDLGADFGFPHVKRQAVGVTTYYSILGPMLDTVTVSFDTISCQSAPDPSDER